MSEPKVHTFDSTGEAYDRSQCDDAIKHGDVLHVPSERVVGILYQAWPIALTQARGEFHSWADTIPSESMYESYRVAERLIANEEYTPDHS